MKQDGTKYTCDRCGKEVFIPEYDYRFADVHRGEIYQLRKGWELSEKSEKVLCPECNQKYKKLMEKFLEDKE